MVTARLSIINNHAGIQSVMPSAKVSYHNEPTSYNQLNYYPISSQAQNMIN